MRILNWEEFDACIKSITISCEGKYFTGVYGVPRGGLCLAVALSHSLNIPLLKELKRGCLIIDDVYETGLTLNNLSNTPDTTTFVWFSKVTPLWWNAVETTNSDEWLVFPWENKILASEELKAYQLSRANQHD